MRKYLVLFSSLFILLFASACNDETKENTNDQATEEAREVSEEKKSDEPDKKDDETQDNQAEKAENQDDMKRMMKNLDFYEIEVDVSYGKDKEFEMEIEHDSNGDVEAEVEDELNGNNINDDLDAFNYIYPKIKDLKVDKGTDKDEIIANVLSAFDLNDDYEKFKAEFEFEDGSKLSYEDKK